MTTFIDFRYSRALAAALFAGQEKEETEIRFSADGVGYVALDVGELSGGAEIARLLNLRGDVAASIVCPPLASRDRVSRVVAVRVSSSSIGFRAGHTRLEQDATPFGGSEEHLILECANGVSVLGQGTGRARRWAELYYHRESPAGLCVEITMDWHHLRAGIPLFGTMTAEELVAANNFRLRFRSYAYEESDAEVTDFVRLFGCDDPPDIAMHLTPALYDKRTPGLPNLGFGVIETDTVHPHLVERCNRMDRICVPSSYTRDTFTRNGVTRPIDVVLHGVDTEFYRPLADARLPGGKGFNFLAVGTHVERKNIRHLVRAFLEEFREAEDVALFLLLRPEYYATQNNVALEFTDWEREYAGDSAGIFLWTGYLTREHLRDFYAGADAYVMPSNEGFGLTLLEAMSCGTPVIGLNYGGVIDFVNQRNGILVPTGRSYVAEDIDMLPYVGDTFHEPDVDSLRQSMRRMFEDRDLVSRLGAQARVDAARLTWQSVTAELTSSIERTYADYHALQKPKAADDRDVSRLTIVLRILDDADARKSLDYLRTLRGVRILCLFTRYARLEDVTRARRYGFAYYRWDGTAGNAKVIARSIMGRSWIVLLGTDEQLSGDFGNLMTFLEGQHGEIDEVEVDCEGGGREPRLVHVRPQGESSGKTLYSGVSVRRLGA